MRAGRRSWSVIRARGARVHGGHWRRQEAGGACGAGACMWRAQAGGRLQGRRLQGGRLQGRRLRSGRLRSACGAGGHLQGGRLRRTGAGVSGRVRAAPRYAHFLHKAKLTGRDPICVQQRFKRRLWDVLHPRPQLNTLSSSSTQPSKYSYSFTKDRPNPRYIAIGSHWLRALLHVPHNTIR